MNNTKRRRNLLTLTALAFLLAAPAWADGPGELKFDEDSFEVIEEAGLVEITVERSGGETGAVSVDYMTTASGTAADGADFTGTSGTLTWADDDGGDMTFTVEIHDDDEMEGEETFELVLSNPTGGATIDPLRGLTTVVILASDGGTGDDDDDSDGGTGDDDDDSDDDSDGGTGDDDDDSDDDSDGGTGDDDDDSDGDGGSAGTLKFDEGSFEVLEDAGVVIVTVERSHGETGAVSVDYSTGDGTATDGVDYTAVTGTLDWFDGDGTDRTFVVPILDDADEEGDESFDLELSNATGGATVDSERGTAVVRILANDGGGPGNGPGDDGPGGEPGDLKFSSSSYQVLENGGVAIITVERSGGEAGEVSVDYMTLDDTAFDGVDYAGAAGTLTWAAGDSGNQTLMVPILDDDLGEGNKTLTLVLSNPTGGAGIDPRRGEAVLTIVDDDAASCQGDALCLEGGRFEVEVTWTNPQGSSGAGKPIALSDQSGLFWFFDRGNVEMLIKVLDACRQFDAFWVFYAATTNVELDVKVTDTRTGMSKTYHNPLGQAAEPVQDTATFRTCD